MKSYFRDLSISDSRLRFKIAAKMTPRVATNFKNDAKFKASGWLCVGCPPLPKSHGNQSQQSSSSPLLPELDTQEHIRVCVAYSDLRDGLDLESDKDIVTYFRHLIERRIKNEERDNN